jgi:hypothetical protein
MFYGYLESQLTATFSCTATLAPQKVNSLPPIQPHSLTTVKFFPQKQIIEKCKEVHFCHQNMKGYKKIATLMGKYPELGTVSRFSSLNIQNLLYMQAELIGLQQDLHELETVNDRSPDEVKASFSRNWLALKSAQEHDGSDEQWKLVLLIREKLKEYSECS